MGAGRTAGHRWLGTPLWQAFYRSGERPLPSDPYQLPRLGRQICPRHARGVGSVDTKKRLPRLTTMSDRKRRISPSSRIYSVTTGLKASAIATKDLAIAENGDATREEFPGVKSNFNCRQSFYPKIVRWMILKITGKSSERLSFESEVYRINGRSPWRAHWRRLEHRWLRRTLD